MPTTRWLDELMSGEHCRALRHRCPCPLRLLRHDEQGQVQRPGACRRGGPLETADRYIRCETEIRPAHSAAGSGRSCQPPSLARKGTYDPTTEAAHSLTRVIPIPASCWGHITDCRLQPWNTYGHGRALRRVTQAATLLELALPIACDVRATAQSGFCRPGSCAGPLG